LNADDQRVEVCNEIPDAQLQELSLVRPPSKKADERCHLVAQPLERDSSPVAISHAELGP
jgi:hypothetical protein